MSSTTLTTPANFAATIEGTSTPLTGNILTNDPTPIFTGTDTPGVFIDLDVDGTADYVRGPNDATGTFSVTPTMAFTTGANTVSASQSSANGAVRSASSAPIQVYTISAPVNGVSTSTLTMADVNSLEAQGYQLKLLPNTVVHLADGTTLACFCQGTRIATPEGEAAVETLATGDLVLTVSGAAAPVHWIGQRRMQLAGHPQRELVQPVRIEAGAFGRLPLRDLLLSPEHAVLVDGALIPVRHLVGCTGIAVDTVLDATTYYHVELPRHDVVLAEGLPCESWLDTGNRAMFENNAVTALRFDERGDGARVEAYAPLVEHGPLLEAVRQRLGADGVQDVSLDGPGVYRVSVAAGAGLVRLVCPAVLVPGDARRLGAAIAGLALDDHAVELADLRLGHGFHAAEPAWRWTDGAGQLALGFSAQPRLLTVEVAAMAQPASAAA